MFDVSAGFGAVIAGGVSPGERFEAIFEPLISSGLAMFAKILSTEGVAGVPPKILSIDGEEAAAPPALEGAAPNMLSIEGMVS